MRKDIIEILDFEEEKPKVGRPKKADKKTKKNSLIFAGVSFFIVMLLLVFGYGTLVGFDNLNLLATANNKSNKTKILIDEIRPLIKDITIKEQTARKLYVTIFPSNATNKELKYISSDENIVRVDKNGKVVGVSEGEAFVVVTTKDGSEKEAYFNVKVVKNASGSCSFKDLSKDSKGINYDVECENAKIKEIQYKTDGDYKTLITKKMNDYVKLSKEDLNKKIEFKVVYYPNNSKITKYSTKTINNIKLTTTKKSGKCDLSIITVDANSSKYDITCENANVSRIAYKIGNGSYIGISTSNLADTIIFEESEVTRIIYFNVEYSVDGSSRVYTINKSSIIEKVDKKNTTTQVSNENIIKQ